MEQVNFVNDIKVFCVTADSFPDGVIACWQKLHSFFAAPKERTYYGISFGEKNGNIIYKAATKEEYDGEAEKYGCEIFIIKKGTYIGETIKDFMKDIPAIGRTFNNLLAHPGINKNGYCLEIYLNEKDVQCLVKLKDKKINNHKKAAKMETTNTTLITVEATVNASTEKVWKLWTEPEHITKWNNASDDWHTPHAENDLREGGKFMCRMEAKDGSFGFDFGGVYNEVKNNEYIAYTMNDGRKAEITFTANGNDTTISETFEAETENSIDLQRGGWQAILNNFKKYTEEN